MKAARLVFPQTLSLRLNLASCITLSRLFFLPPIMAAVALGWQHGLAAAATLTAVAGATDVLDGYMARRFRQVTPLGTNLDLIVDKLFVSSMTVFLACLSIIPVWMPAVIIVREAGVSLLRMNLSRKGVAVGPDALGKAKTATSIAAIVWLLLQQGQNQGGWLSRASDYPAVKAFLDLAPWVMLLAVILTVVSGANYFFRFLCSSKRRAARHPASQAQILPASASREVR